MGCVAVSERPLHKVVYRIVSQDFPAPALDKGWWPGNPIWLQRTQLSSLTLTGTPRAFAGTSPSPQNRSEETGVGGKGSLWMWLGGEVVVYG